PVDRRGGHVVGRTPSHRQRGRPSPPCPAAHRARPTGCLAFRCRFPPGPVTTGARFPVCRSCPKRRRCEAAKFRTWVRHAVRTRLRCTCSRGPLPTLVSSPHDPREKLSPMRTVFLHGEVELFDEAVETMTEQFTKWCAECGAANEGNWLVGFLLREKWTRDGLLALWTVDDIRSLLTESAPRDLILDGGWSSVPEFLHHWLDFLQANELLMTGSDPLEQLHSAVDAATRDYLAAMAESSEWSSAKSWSV